jgi:hypothetical protein
VIWLNWWHALGEHGKIKFGNWDLATFSTRPEKLGCSTKNQGFQAAKIARNPVFGVGARLLMNFAHKLISLIGIWFKI